MADSWARPTAVGGGGGGVGVIMRRGDSMEHTTRSMWWHWWWWWHDEWLATFHELRGRNTAGAHANLQRVCPGVQQPLCLARPDDVASNHLSAGGNAKKLTLLGVCTQCAAQGVCDPERTCRSGKSLLISSIMSTWVSLSPF